MYNVYIFLKSRLKQGRKLSFALEQGSDDDKEPSTTRGDSAFNTATTTISSTTSITQNNDSSNKNSSIGSSHTATTLTEEEKSESPGLPQGTTPRSDHLCNTARDEPQSTTTLSYHSDNNDDVVRSRHNADQQQQEQVGQCQQKGERVECGHHHQITPAYGEERGKYPKGITLRHLRLMTGKVLALKAWRVSNSKDL